MNKLNWVIVAVLVTTTFNSHAQIQFNGFASIISGVTTSSDDRLYGFDNTLDFKQGSLFAVQASTDLAASLGVTAQIIARGENDWEPKFEWAYLSYDASENFRLLAGKQRVPFYMYSDFLDVSYAYSWITPPPGVYSLVFDSFNGFGAIYTDQFGAIDTSFHAIYGSNDDEFTLLGMGVQPKFKHLYGGAFTLSRDWLTVRTAYFQAEMNIPVSSLAPLVAGWQQAGFTDIANMIEVAQDTGRFFELGVQIDYNDYLLLGEFTNLTLKNTPLGDQESYYILLGKRMDDLLFYLTYGGDKNTKDNFVAGVPTGLAPSLDFLINTTEGLIISQRTKSDYFTFGARWDFHPSAALKFEYTQFNDDINKANDADLIKVGLVTVF
jgi:hypothetical protein